MQSKFDANRYVQLTASGLKRVEQAMRRYRRTVDDIAFDRETPSRNTVKRALKMGPVFVNTLDRIWDYLQRCAGENREALPDLRRGEDYLYVDVEARKEEAPPDVPAPPVSTDTRRGWLSRQVPRRNRLFTGRRVLLDRIHAALSAGPAALVPDPQALIGLGGIGKTQTATAYVYEHWQDYNGVFWINAETVQALDTGLAGLAHELQLLDDSQISQQAALRKMQDWLQANSGWLLVLDNVDELDSLAPHFPRHHTGSLLLTTRTRNTVKWAAPIHVVELDGRDGALLLLRRAGLLDTKLALAEAPVPLVSAARELSAELGGLPLALEQAGAYIAETGVSVETYLADYLRRGIELLDRCAGSDHRSVSITFTLALDLLGRHGVHGCAAIEMIRVCAFLDPDAIPEAILQAFLRDAATGTLGAEQTTLHATVFREVCGYSLMSRSALEGTLTIHRLVQRVVAESMSKEENRSWSERAIRAVASATPDFEFEDWSLCELLLPHWRVCAENILNFRIETPEAAYLLYQAARYFRVIAQFEESERLFLLALSIMETVHGEGSSETADCADALACLYRELDRCDESSALHRRALAIVEDLFGADDPRTASKLHNLALLHAARYEYSEAEALFKRVLAIREMEDPPNSSMIAAANTQLGGVLRAQARYADAEACYRRALTICTETLPDRHVDIATACNNLALLYLAMEQADSADALFTRALSINEDIRGSDHPETGVVVWGLALVRAKQNRSKEADTFFRRALHIHESCYGQSHARTVRLSATYADFLSTLQ